MESNDIEYWVDVQCKRGHKPKAVCKLLINGALLSAGLLSVALSLSGCTNTTQKVAESALAGNTGKVTSTVTSAVENKTALTNFANGIQFLNSRYKSGVMNVTDVASACASGVLLQQELASNPDLQKDSSYADKINKAYETVKTFDITKSGLKVEGDVKGTLPKLVTVSQSLAQMVNGSGSSVGVISSAVSEASPPISSAVVISSSASGSGATSHQAPVSSKPASTVPTSRPVSTKPASKPVSTKAASKPTSTAPTSKPASQVPVSTSISARYFGSTYGAADSAQYNAILSYAKGVTTSSAYKKNYDANMEYKDQFETAYGVSYSDDAAMITAIIGCFGNASSSGSHGDAYNAFTKSSSQYNCADTAKAIQAAMHVRGYDCKVIWGKNARGQLHMWTSIYFGGAWHEWGTGKFSSGTPSGYTVYGSGYNY